MPEHGITPQQRVVLDRIRDDQQWPTFERPEFLEELNLVACDALAKDTGVVPRDHRDDGLDETGFAAQVTQWTLHSAHLSDSLPRVDKRHVGEWSWQGDRHL